MLLYEIYREEREKQGQTRMERNLTAVERKAASQLHCEGNVSQDAAPGLTMDVAGVWSSGETPAAEKGDVMSLSL